MLRYLTPSIGTLALGRNKMALLSGPRQVGKTTLARSLQPSYEQSRYLNWDETEFRRLWTRSPNQVAHQFKLESLNERKLLILDEIHKSKGWKQKLKGLYDHLGEQIQIVVTGSSRLNVYRRGGDSMMGRYLHFRLHPFSYGEVCGEPPLAPDAWLERALSKPAQTYPQKPLDQLFAMSGFPEPYLANSEQVLNLWRQGRIDKIIREDLRDLSRLPELSQVEMLASLLPTKIGSPLSIQSLREDVEVAHDTVSRWMRYLNELYYFFELKPWSKSLPRSLKKEGKIYLYDWTEIENPGPRYENLLACHLKKACDFWTDTGIGKFDLFYVRTKDKLEIDFLIVRNQKPWLAVEAKLSEAQPPTPQLVKLIQRLKCPYVQAVMSPHVWLRDQRGVITSAHHLLWGLA